mmetsp:Transcript_37848/g.87478  ORF Transcript_37848/g.87478 Transcript_37848/m.87478 type:complete len:226 (+) Transcript_37848:5334-6011(+)
MANFEGLDKGYFQGPQQPISVLLIGETVTKDANVLVAVAPDHGHGLRHLLGFEGAHALEHLPNVPEVESVVALRRRGKELFLRFLKDLDRAIHNLWLQGLNAYVEALREEVAQNRREDVRDGVPGCISSYHGAIVALQPPRDLGPATSRRSHRGDVGDVNDFLHLELSAIIPAMVVMPLPKQFNRRLRAIILLLWHVQVVDKNDVPLACWRSKDSSSPLLKLRVQ